MNDRQLLALLGFRLKNNHMVKKDFRDTDQGYLSGGWLEERFYLGVKEAVPNLTDVCLGIKYQDRDRQRK